MTHVHVTLAHAFHLPMRWQRFQTHNNSKAHGTDVNIACEPRRFDEAQDEAAQQEFTLTPVQVCGSVMPLRCSSSLCACDVELLAASSKPFRVARPCSTYCKAHLGTEAGYTSFWLEI